MAVVMHGHPLIINPVGTSRIGSLTKQQRACLAKVAELKKSEVIAFELGISLKTVDSHIAEACRRLGVSSRREAARILLAETEGFPRKVILPISPDLPIPHSEVSPGEGSNSVRDVHRAPTFDYQPSPPASASTTGGTQNVQLFVALKAAMLIVVMATCIILALVGFKFVVSDAEDLANTIQPPSHNSH